MARDDAPQEVLDDIVGKGSRLLRGAPLTVVRYGERGGEAVATVLASHGGAVAVGAQWSAEGETATGQVRRTGRPWRTDSFEGTSLAATARELGVTAGVAAPILVEGEVWGALTTESRDGPMPQETEERLAEVSDLFAAAITGFDARRRLHSLAEEQSALRRVAESVARGDPEDVVFETVASEASALIDDVPVTLTRFEGGSKLIVVARCGGPAPIGTRIAFAPDTLPDRVLRSGAPTRVDDYTRERDADLAAAYGMSAAVSAPVVVDGRPWGMLTATSPAGPLPRETDARLEQFAQLTAFAIGNAENRAKLTESRARVLATADEARRRLQRDVHDGAQQRLVQTVIALKLARHALAEGDPAVPELLEEALHHAERATAELRDVVRGIMPASLSTGGLRAGVESLVYDLPLPVEVEIVVPRLPAQVETTAYFIVAEALTNVVKHAGATCAGVEARIGDRRLELVVRDDGTGGARPAGGTGLLGLADRVEACHGTLSVASAAGAGTTVSASLPLDAP